MRLFEGTEFDIPPRCEECEALEADCKCPPKPETPELAANPEKQTARVRLEKRKKGKWVTVVAGLDPTGNHLSELLTSLKNSCGAGGTIQDQVIEIQGDHVDRIRGLLKAKGYRTKN